MANFKKILIIALLFFLGPSFALAEETGQAETFFVDSNYDASERKEVEAELKLISDHAYFYLEQKWFNSRSEKAQQEIKDNLKDLSQEFNDNIYPEITSTFGQEWKPGIDDDERITILFHSMRERGAGYFRSNDEYEKIRAYNSNEREMFYLNIDYLYFKKRFITSYTAHELVHLITFNQKEKLRDVQEEVWLNELRADYAPTIMGYNADDYGNSMLATRIRTFLDHPTDALTEWSYLSDDYGVINAISHYLVDHYGREVLVDSLHSPEKGVESLNHALQENGFEKDFQEVFKEWTLAVFLNNCEIGDKYCYLDDNLENLSVPSEIIFLPNSGDANISANYDIKPWSGHWYKIMGQKGDLKVKVDGDDRANFKIPYVVKDLTYEIGTLSLNEKQVGSTTIENFGEEYESFTLLPFVANEATTTYNLSVDISVSNNSEQEQKETERLRQRVAELQQRVEELLKKLEEQEQQKQKYACVEITNNLKVGMRNEQVKCLQQFLKDQGKDIYPEGLVTGYFGPLTKQAVIRFQEAHQQQILAPWSLQNGTGYVGRTTKEQINEMMNNR